MTVTAAPHRNKSKNRRRGRGSNAGGGGQELGCVDFRARQAKVTVESERENVDRERRWFV